MSAGGAVGAVLPWVLGILALSIVLSLGRLLRGPTLPDRVVALDAIGVQSAGLMAVYSIAAGRSLYLDLATALALVAFLGTTALAGYVRKGPSR